MADGTASDWLTSQFDFIERNLNGSRGSELHGVRLRGWKEFKTLGIPGPKNEEWRYTDIRSALRSGFALPEGLPSKLDRDAAQSCALLSEAAARVVLWNGLYCAELSSASLPKGVTVRSLKEALSASGDEAWRKHFAAVASEEEHPFVGLNSALFQGGVLIHVSRNVKVDLPVEIAAITDSADSDVLNAPRVLILVEEGASLTVVEHFVSLSDRRSMTCSVVEVVLEQNGEFDHYKIGNEAESTVHVDGLHARVGRDARFRSHQFSFGGAVTRNESHLLLEGSGSHSVLNGLTVLAQAQHTDNYTVIRHAVPHCESNERYKGIYGGKSRGAFQGTIIVDKDAQKTNAIQSNQALLLSNEAAADAKPQLKIWADDVKCTHGATVGQLDANALFYLRSRGIEESTARALLTEAFAGEIISEVRIPELQERMRRSLLRKLGTEHE